MVVGNGMIATRFNDYKNNDRFIIFASGVSNSSANNIEAFDREKELIIETKNKWVNKCFIYFSTCSIYDETLSFSPYVQHKLKMESLAEDHVGGYIIFRVSNPIGKTDNKHTLLNYFINAIRNNQPFKVYSGAKRNLIDLDDMYKLCNYVLQQSLFSQSIVNIANPNSYSILYIVNQLEKYFLQEAIFTTLDKHSVPGIDTTVIGSLFQKLNLKFDDNYLMRLLQKYYPLL